MILKSGGKTTVTRKTVKRHSYPKHVDGFWSFEAKNKDDIEPNTKSITCLLQFALWFCFITCKEKASQIKTPEFVFW